MRWVVMNEEPLWADTYEYGILKPEWIICD